MTTTVTLTGTGVPHPSPGRAGAGVLVSYDDVHLQFDAGRGTVLRLADALVHEACRRSAMADAIQGTAFEKIFDYLADSEVLGEFAQRYDIAHVVLTHLIPQPKTDKQIAAFDADLRRGGYTGRVTVGSDLIVVDV